MNRPFSFGLIGCGRAAERLYLPALLRLPEARLVAASDPLPERMNLIASAVPGCLAFPSAEALIQSETIDAAIIASPTETHVAVARTALAARIPVLIEKPLAPTVAEAEELRALGDSAAIMVGFNRRYWEPVRRLRKILGGNNPSERISARMVITSDAGGWAPICGVQDPLDDLGSHQFDLLRFLFGKEILSVSARRTDTLVMEMRIEMEGGGIAECFAGQTCVSQETIVVRRNAERFEIRMGSERLTPGTGVIRSALDFTDKVSRRLLGRPASIRRSYERELADLISCVRQGVSPQPGLADGIAAIRAVEAARESAANNGRKVHL